MTIRTGAMRAVGVLRQEGVRGLAQRAVRRAHQALDAGEIDFPIHPGDIADSTVVRPSVPRPPWSEARPPVVGWITTPPALGSGGHTTMFRMIQGLEAAGFVCRVLLYDRHGGDVAEQARTVRRGWPWVRADVLGVDTGLAGLDACFATGWESAHVAATRLPSTVRKLYFIQDYEPYFYPRGSLYALAEDTYRFGFRNVALGSMVAERLRVEAGVDSTVVPFGNDDDVYRLLPSTTGRRGVVFYAKPDTARRGYPHVRMALAEFHRRHPDEEIHGYGTRLGAVDFPVTWHGRLWPTELNELYNRTVGGIAMSFTNISLVAGEMLAAGCIPVVNDSPMARADLASPYAVWAPATPTAIADALSQIVTARDVGARAAAAADSVRLGWSATQAACVDVVRDELALAAPADTRAGRHREES